MSAKKSEPASEPEYESLVLPNFRNQRNYLASIAPELTDGELRERAADAGIDLSGTKTKAEVVDRVRDAVRPVTVTDETEA